jgi:SAM-dependent methyltransferase
MRSSTIRAAVKKGTPAWLHPPLRKCLRLARRIFATPVSYEQRVQKEFETFKGQEVVHDLPLIAHYWSNKFLVPMLAPFGFTDSIQLFRTYIARVCKTTPDETCRVLSIGAGNCESEINIAEWLREVGIQNFRIECVEINTEMLKRAQASTQEKGLTGHFSFASFDVNTWQPSSEYDVILAIQCLHHFVELEQLFEKIHRALRRDGYFMTDDMIGRNGHQRWPEALAIVNRLWTELPEKYKYNHGLHRVEKTFENWDCSSEGFEGIRSQDILPLLVQRFHFDFFFGFGNVIDIFIDRSFGPNFDPEKEWDQAFIDRVHAIDVAGLESGQLKPTHMMAAMTKTSMGQTRVFKHFTPEFCIRPVPRTLKSRLKAMFATRDARA